MRSWATLSIAVLLLLDIPAIPQSRANSQIGDNGPAVKALLYDPRGLAVDDNYLYILESQGKRVRRVNLKSGIITTLADGGKRCHPDSTSPPLCLSNPQRIAVDPSGDVFVTDEGIPGRVDEIVAGRHSFSNLISGKVDLHSDTSDGGTTSLEWPNGITVDPAGGLFFDDHTAHVIYHFRFDTARLEIIAGTGRAGFRGDQGPARAAEFNFPDGLTRDANGNLLVADSDNCRIQRIDPKTAIVTTLAGTEDDGSTCEGHSPAAAELDQPTDVAVDVEGDVFFVQPWRERVRKIHAETGTVSTVAGNGVEGFSGDDGPAIEASLHFPWGICVDRKGKLNIADSSNGRIRQVDLKTGRISTVAGNGPISPDIIL